MRCGKEHASGNLIQSRVIVCPVVEELNHIFLLELTPRWIESTPKALKA
jgi:hypothetical protein